MLILWDFVSIAEHRGLLRRTLIPIARNSAHEPEFKLLAFAMAFYNVGLGYLLTLRSLPRIDDQREMIVQGEMAFRSALLCTPVFLPAAWGMASLMIGYVEPKHGLRWCQWFTELDERLQYSMMNPDVGPVERIISECLSKSAEDRRNEMVAAGLGHLLKGIEIDYRGEIRHLKSIFEARVPS